MPTIDRRSLLLGALGLPALAHASTPVAVRNWSGRGEVLVVATPQGDPRFHPDTPSDSALLLLRDLVGKRDTVMSATGISGPDAAKRAAADLPSLRLIDGGYDESTALLAAARVAHGLAMPHNPAFRARRASLARPGSDSGGYERLRADGLERVRLARAAVDAQILARLSTLPKRAIVVVPVLMATAWCAAVEADGRGGALYASDTLDERIDDSELWWTGIIAGLPESIGYGLEPWTVSLAPYIAALKTWPRLAEVQDAIDASTGPVPPILDPVGLYMEKVRAAADYLRARSLPADITKPVAEGASEGLAMSYNSWTDSLHVAPSSAHWPTPLTAAVLFHELVHVRDVGDLCAQLGISPKMFATALDTLPAGIGVGMLCSMEDRAYGEEVAVLGTLGIPLPDPAAPIQPDPVSRLLQLLSMLKSTPMGSPTWLSLVDTIVMQRFQKSPID